MVGSPETDPLPETADITFIGPVLWQTQEGLPDLHLSSDQPVIWLYAGNLQYLPGSESPFDSLVVVEASIEALRDMAVQVVLTTGHQSLPHSLSPLPPNFQHVDFVPGLRMSERSDLLIHHGGYGSCQTGLYTGTPAVIIPTYSERESNARRIAALGAGEFILPAADETGRGKKIDPAEMRAKISLVLSDTSYRENAQRIGERMRSFGGPEAAARLIDDFVTGLTGITQRAL